MRKNKRIGSLVLALLLVVSMVGSTLSVGVVGASGPVLSVDNKTVTTGEQFEVTVTLENTGSVCGGNFTLQYDSNLLTVDSYSFGNIVSGHTKNCNLNYQSAGKLIRVTFSGAEAISGDGTLVTFTFTAKAAGTATLRFNANKMYDENGSAITTIVNGSTVTITEKAVPTPVISIDDQSVTVGQTVSVPVVISNCVAIYGGNFTLQYDSNLLTVDSYSFGSIVSGHTKNCNLNYQSAGNLIRVTFSGAEAISGDGTLVTFTFTANAAGTATLQFNANKMYDENGVSVNVSSAGGYITVTPPQLTAIEVTKLPNKVIYHQGDYLETKGLELTGTYSNGQTAIITSGYMTSWSDAALGRVGSYTIQVSYQGLAASFEIVVQEMKAVLSQESISLETGETTTLDVIHYPIEGENLTYHWTSSDTNVVAVQDGVLTAVGPGTAKVWFVFSNNGFAVESNPCVVTVAGPSITLSSYYKKMSVGDTYTITTTTTPSGQAVTWTSSNTSVATVSGGTITAKASGSATITAKFTYNNKEYTRTCTVNVVGPIGIEIETLPEKTTLYVGDPFDRRGLKVRMVYSDGSYESGLGVTSTNFDSVGAFLSEGKRTVIVYCGEYSTSYEIIVKPLTAELRTTNLGMFIGEETHIVYSTSPDDMSLLVSAKWDSSDKTVATVDTNGLVTAVGVGTAKITLTIVNGVCSTTSNSCTVTVYGPSISLSAGTLLVPVGDTSAIIASTSPEGQVVTWVSSDTSVATVINGVVAAKAPGTTEITASFIYNGITHSKTCSVTVKCYHTDKTEVPFLEATCTEPGNRRYFICNTCGEILKADGVTLSSEEAEVIMPLGHDFANATCTEPEVCKNCGTTTGSAVGHTYCYQATKAPTTSATGTLTGICTKCSSTTTVTLPKLNSTEYSYAVEKQPSSTATGTGRYTWNTTTYGAFFFDVTLDKLGVLGDINGDGKVNMKDWNRLYEHLTEVSVLTGEALRSADVNGDGKVNMKDWNRIYEHLSETNPLW